MIIHHTSTQLRHALMVVMGCVVRHQMRGRNVQVTVSTKWYSDVRATIWFEGKKVTAAMKRSAKEALTRTTVAFKEEDIDVT